MRRVFCASLLTLLPLSIHAATLLDFSDKSLGLNWSATSAELERQFPGLTVTAQSLQTYKGPLRIGPLSFDNEVVLFTFDKSGRLATVFTRLSAKPAQLIGALDKQFGPSRFGTYPEGNGHHHAHDWNFQGHTAELSYYSLAKERLGEPVGDHEIQLQMWREKPKRTMVDDALEQPHRATAMKLLLEQATKKQETERQQRQLAAETTPSGPTPVNAPGKPPLIKANSTWGAALNPGGHASVGMFKAYYLNTDNPRTAVATDYVTDIAINYAFQDFHNIPSEDFAAYWVGKLRFKKDEDKLLNFGLSQAKARIIVDGFVVYEGERGGAVPYHFTTGDHLLEVEFINNWHTTDFKFSLIDQMMRLNTDQARGELRRAKLLNVPAHYVVVHESRRPDLSITLDASRLQGSAVLVLSSHGPVKWAIENAQSARIKAVVLADQELGSEIVGFRDPKPLILVHNGWLGEYQEQSRCQCFGNRYRCEKTGNYITDSLAAARVTEGNIASLSGAYAGDHFSLPGSPVTSQLIEEAKAHRVTNHAEMERCSKSTNPEFEEIMKSR